MQEINLYDLLRYYAKNWLFILIFTIAGLTAGLIYNNFVQKPMYKSSATLLVVNADASSADQKTTKINNYLQLLESRRVLEPVVQELGFNTSYDQLAGSVSVNNDKDTEVVKLSISSSNPEDSKKLVDATIESFKDEVTRLYKVDTIQVIDSASLPTEPYNVRTTIQLALFTTAGLLLSIIIVYFKYDYKLSSGKDLFTTKPKKQKAPKKTSSHSNFRLSRRKKQVAAPSKKPSKQQKPSTAKAVRDPKTGRFAPKSKK